MNHHEANTIISNTVQSVLPGSRVVLFGSRARGNYDQFSDFDLLIITPATLSGKEKIELHSKLDRAIVKAIHMPVDLLINSEEEIKEKMVLPGHIIRSVMNQGVAI